MNLKLLLSTALTTLSCACLSVTEGGLVEFSAGAAGPADATGGPLAFRTETGFEVILRKARLHVGAVYLNGTVPLSAERESSCVLPGTYVAQIRAAADVDLLSSTPVMFPGGGSGLADRARNGEVWLTGNGNVDVIEDKVPIFSFEGEARRGGVTYPFSGSFSIGSNRAKPPRKAELPGSNPICQERIVTGIATDLLLRDGGTLTLRADPRAIFARVDFEALEPNASGVREFLDRDEGAPSIDAYNALRSSAGVYSFAFE